MPKFLSDEELQRLIRATRERRHRNSTRDRAILAVLANSGMRPGELVAMHVCDVHTGTRPRLRIRRLKKRAGGVVDDIPISSSLARVLRLYTRGRAGDDWLFPAMRNTPRPLTVRSLERLFSFYARRAGLEGSPRLYTLRHTAARRLYAVTRDLRLVQRLLGHANSHTTEIYTHVDLEACYGLFDRLGTVL